MSVNSKMTSIADKIRSLLGVTGKMGLDAMASNLGDAVNECDTQADLIAQIKSALEGKAAGGGGVEVYFTPYGVGYTPDMVLDCETVVSPAWKGADKIKSLELTEWNPFATTNIKSENSANLNDIFGYTSLETLKLPKLQYGAHYVCRGSTKLKTVQLGSVGYPISTDNTGKIALYFFRDCTQSDLVITVYVSATTLSEANSSIPNAPWGATNATIIYRNSTTGEVITA